MKHKLKLVALLAVGIYTLSSLFNTSYSSVQAQAYNIDVKIKGLQDTSLYLAYYFDEKMLVKDSIVVDSNGRGTFTGAESLHGGLYLIYTPSDQRFFDVIIDDQQKFSIEVDRKDFINTEKVVGNDQQIAFNEYQRFVAKQQRELNSLQTKIKDNPESDSIDIWNEQAKQISNGVSAYWDKLAIQFKGKFLGVFMNTFREIEQPNIDPTLPKDTIQVKTYYYYKDHYFDNIDLSDNRLLYTPILGPKLKTYFEKRILQIPDSIVKESNYVIGLAGDDYEMRKYLIQFTFNYVVESKRMGMDKAMVALGEKYYLSGEADWVDEEFLKKLQERITKVKPNLIGNVAPDLSLIDYKETGYYKLSDIYAPFTILVFWEPDCGHCKTEIPKLKKEVFDKYADKGVKIYAVCTLVETEHWTKFIEDNQLEEWTNVYDPYNQSNYRNLYDIYSTPVIYILDENKKIVAKRIPVDQISDFFEFEFNKDKK